MSSKRRKVYHAHNELKQNHQFDPLFSFANFSLGPIHLRKKYRESSIFLSSRANISGHIYFLQTFNIERKKKLLRKNIGQLDFYKMIDNNGRDCWYCLYLFLFNFKLRMRAQFIINHRNNATFNFKLNWELADNYRQG